MSNRNHEPRWATHSNVDGLIPTGVMVIINGASLGVPVAMLVGHHDERIWSAGRSLGHQTLSVDDFDGEEGSLFSWGCHGFIHIQRSKLVHAHLLVQLVQCMSCSIDVIQLDARLGVREVHMMGFAYSWCEVEEGLELAIALKMGNSAASFLNPSLLFCCWLVAVRLLHLLGEKTLQLCAVVIDRETDDLATSDEPSTNAHLREPGGERRHLLVIIPNQVEKEGHGALERGEEIGHGRGMTVWAHGGELAVRFATVGALTSSSRSALSAHARIFTAVPSSHAEIIGSKMDERENCDGSLVVSSGDNDNRLTFRIQHPYSEVSGRDGTWRSTPQSRHQMHLLGRWGTPWLPRGHGSTATAVGEAPVRQRPLV